MTGELFKVTGKSAINLDVQTRVYRFVGTNTTAKVALEFYDGALRAAGWQPTIALGDFLRWRKGDLVFTFMPYNKRDLPDDNPLREYSTVLRIDIVAQPPTSGEKTVLAAATMTVAAAPTR